MKIGVAVAVAIVFVMLWLVGEATARAFPALRYRDGR